MTLRRAVSVTAVAVGAFAAASGTATAAFPNFSDCPRSNPVVKGCIDVQSRSGSMTIKGFTVPIGESLEIRGGLDYDTGTFYAPVGTTGLFSRPIQVPGGLLGINFPIPGNAVTATAQLAGPPSSIRINVGDLSISMPVKLKLSNPLIGPGCQIGSNANPARLNLITGTTSPPPPNRPISGAPGTVVVQPNYFAFIGNRNVDNSFAVPSANSCGLGLHLIDALVNAKLRLPSAAGNNEMIIVNDAALGNARPTG